MKRFHAAGICDCCDAPDDEVEVHPTQNGLAAPDLDERGVHHAALELARAAGRPELVIADLSPLELEGWRVCVRRTIRAYRAVVEFEEAA